jgi:hypothetical protein
VVSHQGLGGGGTYLSGIVEGILVLFTLMISFSPQYSTRLHVAVPAYPLGPHLSDKAMSCCCPLIISFAPTPSALHDVEDS